MRAKSALVCPCFVVALGAVGCGSAPEGDSAEGPGGSEPTAFAQQADTASDLLGIIADSSKYVSFMEDPSVAAAIGLVSLAKDAWAISLEGDSNPSSSSAVQAQMNQLQSEINGLYGLFAELDQRELAGALAENFDIANGARTNIEGYAQYLSSHIGEVMAHTASDGVMRGARTGRRPPRTAYHRSDRAFDRRSHPGGVPFGGRILVPNVRDGAQSARGARRRRLPDGSRMGARTLSNDEFEDATAVGRRQRELRLDLSNAR